MTFVWLEKDSGTGLDWFYKPFTLPPTNMTPDRGSLNKELFVEKPVARETHLFLQEVTFGQEMGKPVDEVFSSFGDVPRASQKVRRSFAPAYLFSDHWG